MLHIIGTKYRFPVMSIHVSTVNAWTLDCEHFNWYSCSLLASTLCSKQCSNDGAATSHQAQADGWHALPVSRGTAATWLITLPDNTAQHANAETAQVSWVYTYKSCWYLAAHIKFLLWYFYRPLSLSRSSQSRSAACTCSCTHKVSWFMCWVVFWSLSWSRNVHLSSGISAWMCLQV